jgi:hypothetical protein
MNEQQAERLAGWWAGLTAEQRSQAVATLRAQPRRVDDNDDAWRPLVPQWVSVTESRSNWTA